MQVRDDDDLYKGQRLTQVKCDKQCPIDLQWPEESLSKLKMMMTFIKVKGQRRSNVVNYVLWLPYLVTRTAEARLIQKCIRNMRLCSDLFTDLVAYVTVIILRGFNESDLRQRPKQVKQSTSCTFQMICCFIIILCKVLYREYKPCNAKEQ